jgi:putative transposase
VRKYWTGAHSKHRLLVHVVFVPKYRRRVLLGKVAVRLRALFYEAATMNRWWISEMNLQRDHVHLLVQYHASESVAEVVQKLKGGSSLILRREYPELEEWLWGGGFWADGYFAESVGTAQEEMIRRYIREQAQHGPSMPRN